MSKAFFVRSSLFAVLTLGFAACTIHPAGSAPPLTGPSSFGHSLTVTASPDNIAADGSLSSITASYMDESGQPLAGIALQASIAVSGTPVDFGSLSSRTVYTDSTGHAKVVYYAPVMTGFFAGTPAKEVWVTVEPVGGNYVTSVPVHAVIKVTPPPVPVLGADSPIADVIYAPTTPKVGDDIIFNAAGSQAAAGHTIVNYFWDFGDSRPNDEHGNDADHVYAAGGTYTMVLGVTDEAGHSSSTFKTIVVSN